MADSCCVSGCTNKFTRRSHTGFFRFPRNESRKKRWILAAKGRYWRPTDETRICSDHFQTGKPSVDPSHIDYVPNIFIFKSQKIRTIKDEKKKIIKKKSSLQTQASKRNAEESKSLKDKKHKRLKPTAVPSLCLPKIISSEEKKAKGKEKQDKKIKNVVAKTKNIAKAGSNNTSSKISKTSVNSNTSVSNHQVSDMNESSHLSASNENSYTINLNSSSESPILEKQIKVEVPWEREYNFVGNITKKKERWDTKDLGEIMSTPSTLSVEDAESSMQYINTEKFFQEEDCSSENVETENAMDRNYEKINNYACRKGIKEKVEELSISESCSNIKLLEKCKIGRREETFGRFIACEMSDLAENPILYLNTKQIILRALIDAHTELAKSYF